MYNCYNCGKETKKTYNRDPHFIEKGLCKDCAELDYWFWLRIELKKEMDECEEEIVKIQNEKNLPDKMDEDYNFVIAHNFFRDSEEWKLYQKKQREINRPKIIEYRTKYCKLRKHCKGVGLNCFDCKKYKFEYSLSD